MRVSLCMAHINKFLALVRSNLVQIRTRHVHGYVVAVTEAIALSTMPPNANWDAIHL